MPESWRIRPCELCIVVTTILVFYTVVRDGILDRDGAMVEAINTTNANLVEAIKLSRCRCGMGMVKAEATGGSVTISEAPESALEKLTRQVLIRQGKINADVR